MRRPLRYLSLALLAGTIVVIDQATKLSIMQAMRLDESIPIIPNLFSLTYIRNPGAAFSLGESTTYVFTALATIAVILIVRYAPRIMHPAWSLTLALVLAVVVVVALAVGWGGIVYAANNSVQGAKKEEGGFDGDAPTAILIEASGGSVRIGTPEGFGTYFLAPQLSLLGAQHPHLNIELVANPRSFSLSKREADIAISMARPSQGRVYARKLLDFGLGIYASRNYLDSHSPITTRQDLLAHGWIGYVEDLMWTSELDYLPMVDRNIQPRLHISNVISQLTAIEGGAGLGVLPHFMARQSPVLKRVLPTEIHLTRAYWLITHPDTHNLARIRACCDFLTEQAFAHGSDYWMSECS